MIHHRYQPMRTWHLAHLDQSQTQDYKLVVTHPTFNDHISFVSYLISAKPVPFHLQALFPVHPLAFKFKYEIFSYEALKVRPPRDRQNARTIPSPITRASCSHCPLCLWLCFSSLVAPLSLSLSQEKSGQISRRGSRTHGRNANDKFRTSSILTLRTSFNIHFPRCFFMSLCSWTWDNLPQQFVSMIEACKRDSTIPFSNAQILGATKPESSWKTPSLFLMRPAIPREVLSSQPWST